MSDESCYDCGCCECDGLCRVLNKYINEVEECTASEEDRWQYSDWNLHKEGELNDQNRKL